MVKRVALTLEQAKEKCRQGGHVYVDWFGKGWCMVWHTFPVKSAEVTKDGDFFDRNPVTGSLLLHKFTERDEAPWYEGQQLKEIRYDD